MQTQKVLVIVPAYNEERAIQYVVKDILKKYPRFSVLVIDDGSTDNTAQEASRAGATVVSLPINLGIGGAVQTGLKIAHAEGYDAAVQVDGDAQHDIAYLKDVVRPVLAGEFDLCIGSRFLRTRSGFRSTFLRRIGIRFFSWLLRRLTGVRLTDPTSGYRAFGRLLIEQFALSYPSDFPEPETIQRAKRLGAKIGEVPVKMRKRLGGISSIRYLKTIYYMIKVTFAILIDTLRKKK
jgi:glycosyltransferase involved in cell wall biosynthesis